MTLHRTSTLSRRVAHETSALLGLTLLMGACLDVPDELDADALRTEPVYELVPDHYPLREGDATVCSVWEADLGEEGFDRRTEFYLLDRMNEELAEDPGWRSHLGRDRVETCADAREYQQLRFEYEMATPPTPDPSVGGNFPEEPGAALPTGQVDKVGEADGESNHGAVVRLTDTDVSCSGTLIHPRAVLTAAHCFSPGYRKMYLRREENGVVQDWVGQNATVYRHSNYTGIGDAGDDIGMLVFDDPIPGVDTGTETMRVLTSPMSAGDDIVFHGWGIASHDGTGSGVLRYGAVTLDWASSRLFTDEVRQGGARICKGDSGGTARLERSSNNLSFDMVGGMASEFQMGSDYCPSPGREQRWSATADKISWIETRLLIHGIDLTPEDGGTACLRASQSGRDYMRCW